MRYIKALSKTEKAQLEEESHKGDGHRVRRRAHTILLSADGFTIDEIARIYQTDRATVTSTFNRWEKAGLSGLSDEARSGRPPKLSKAERAEAIERLKEDPRSIKKAQAATQKKRVSMSASGR